MHKKRNRVELQFCFHTCLLYTSMDEEGELRLSDAFVKKQEIPNLEVIVKVKNINMGNSRELFEKCRPMRDYMIFVDKVRRYSQEQPLEDAVERTIRECMEEGLTVEEVKALDTDCLLYTSFQQ